MSLLQNTSDPQVPASMDLHPGIQTSSGSVSPMVRMAIGGAALCVAAVCLSVFFPFPEATDTAIFFYRQDIWLLFFETILLLLASLRLHDKARPLHLPQPALPLVAIGLIGICYAGTKWVLCGYEMSRDEQMAVFDALTFSAGHLAQPLPSFWQAHASALNTLYMLPAARPVAWISGYLPMHAALRSVVGLVIDPALTSPLVVAVGAIALWKCARLIWPEDDEAPLVALLLYVGSGQILFAGMSAFAMPAHLAFNLVWLWLFLLGRRSTDLAAVVVGFVATGLHQPLFHPLFAAPIVLTLLRDRNWSRFALYTAGYGAIAAFWLAWPHWMEALVAGPAPAAATAGTDYFTRLTETLSKSDTMRWQEMTANLLRLFAWQHVILLPLLLAAIPAVRRERLPAAFAATLILPICIMAAILPWQGHGFGYRYVHGVLGTAILLAVFGWRNLVVSCAWLRPVLLRTTLGAVLVILPLQGWMAHSFYSLFSQVDHRINASGADYFIVGGKDAPFSHDLVINRPDLSNRPIRLLGEDVDQAVVRNICRSGAHVVMPTSALFRPIEKYFLMKRLTLADARIASLSPRLKAAGCVVSRLDAL